MTIVPIYYCAGYKEEGGEQCKPYNLTKLLYYIIKAIPTQKRIAIADHINDDEEMWEHDDHEDDYKSSASNSILESIFCGIYDGGEAGGDLGELVLGLPGRIVGSVVGGLVGVVKGLFDGIFG